jgi:hypothetical protein
MLITVTGDIQSDIRLVWQAIRRVELRRASQRINVT